MPLSHGALHVDVRRGRASLHMHHLRLVDAHDLINALMHGPTVPATASFAVEWFDPMDRYHLRDAMNDFTGDFVTTSARIRWAATGGGFTYFSDHREAQTTVFANLGNERNGRFFTP